MNQPQLFDQYVIYEYPLNERVRTYLRLEHLCHQLRPHEPVSERNYPQYFSALFAIIELCERSDVRTDLQKDLDRRRQQLVAWQRHPEANQEQIEVMAGQVEKALTALQPMSRVGSNLKQDRLLGSIRQRFAMPGGTCNFDLPQLHYWLHLPQSMRDQNTQSWWDEFKILIKGLELELAMIRGQARFQEVTAVHGLLQESTEPLSLLRLKVPHTLPAYPVVSGHKQRFNIRFLHESPQSGRASYEEDVTFQLARCS